MRIFFFPKVLRCYGRETMRTRNQFLSRKIECLHCWLKLRPTRKKIWGIWGPPGGGVSDQSPLQKFSNF